MENKTLLNDKSFDWMNLPNVTYVRPSQIDSAYEKCTKITSTENFINYIQMWHDTILTNTTFTKVLRAMSNGPLIVNDDHSTINPFGGSNLKTQFDIRNDNMLIFYADKYDRTMMVLCDTQSPPFVRSLYVNEDTGFLHTRRIAEHFRLPNVVKELYQIVPYIEKESCYYEKIGSINNFLYFSFNKNIEEKGEKENDKNIK